MTAIAPPRPALGTGVLLTAFMEDHRIVVSSIHPGGQSLMGPSKIVLYRQYKGEGNFEILGTYWRHELAGVIEIVRFHTGTEQLALDEVALPIECPTCSDRGHTDPPIPCHCTTCGRRGVA